MAPTRTRSPILYPDNPSPSSSITPTGSCPITSPGFTGYSPRTICRSVPQIVVNVIRMTASPTPAVGRDISSMPIWFGPRKTFAFIVCILAPILVRQQPVPLLWGTIVESFLPVVSPPPAWKDRPRLHWRRRELERVLHRHG